MSKRIDVRLSTEEIADLVKMIEASGSDKYDSLKERLEAEYARNYEIPSMSIGLWEAIHGVDDEGSLLAND